MRRATRARYGNEHAGSNERGGGQAAASDLTLSLLPCGPAGGGREPQGIVGGEPDAHQQAQPGGLHGTPHLRTGHESLGRHGESLAGYAGFRAGVRSRVID